MFLKNYIFISNPKIFTEFSDNNFGYTLINI